MPIHASCPSCGRQVKAPDHAAGRTVRCPQCGNSFPMPAVGPAPRLEEAEDLPVRVPPPASREAPPRRPRPDEQDYDDPPAPGPSRLRTEKGVNGLGIASLILGGGAFLFGLIPCIGIISLPFSLLGLLLGLGGILMAAINKRSSYASPIVGSVVSLIAVCIPIAFWVWVATSATAPAREIKEADKLYAEGRPAEAVLKYKDNFNFVHQNRPEILRRIVEEEIKQGNVAEARRWIDKGLEENVEVTYNSPDARKLFDVVRKDRLDRIGREKLDGPPGAAPISVTATALVASYLTSEEDADRRYKDRILEVRGEVDEVNKQDPGQSLVLLKTDDALLRVQCFFPGMPKGRLATLRPGQTVTIRGKCDGRAGNVLLQDCQLTR